MGNVIVSCTSGADSAENVTVAYQTAGAALDAGREVVMWLSVAAGGRFYVSPSCWRARDLDDARLVPGAELRDAGALFEFAGDGAITFSY
jgi:hypothetical protein